MLLFTYKLEKLFKRIFFPVILLDIKKYMIKGSFRRRIPYITDIDIVNNVYPDINKDNIYEKILLTIEALYNYNKTGQYEINLMYIRCGTDDRFKINRVPDIVKINEIKTLLSDNEQREIDKIFEKYKNNTKIIFLINKLLRPYYNLKWTPHEIINNNITVKNNIEVKFTDVLQTNNNLVIRYFTMFEKHPLGFDVAVYYGDADYLELYKDIAEYNIRDTNYAKDYYYMLFPLKRYFKKHDIAIYNKLNYLLEYKYGMYKQIMSKIDFFEVLYKRNLLTIENAKNIIMGIIEDLESNKLFRTNVKTYIENEINSNENIEKWHMLLNLLYGELNTFLSEKSKFYFFHYLDLISEEDKEKFYIDFDQERIIFAP